MSELDRGRREIRVVSPRATSVVTVGPDVDAVELRRSGDEWVGSVPVGARYGLRAFGPPADGFAPDRTLVDPSATAVWFPPGHSRDAARPGRLPNHDVAPLAVAQPWPERTSPRRTSRPLVVYEAHVRGFTKLRDRSDAGTFTSWPDEFGRLAALGVSVVELLPVHQYDPDEGNYWGYMPLVFGAVHRDYAHGDDAALELSQMVDAAHRHDIEVWIDVVVNHTTEEGANGPTYSHRGLDERGFYVFDGHDYVNDAGTGNIVDARSSSAQRLIRESLDRFADLGVDGFRFDLAAVLTRDPDLVRSLGDWAVQRSVRLIAEPWDLRRYVLGRSFPDPRWAQWNGRFRDDMRGFLRGEDGLVSAVQLRLQGSPDLFDQPDASINFLTAHDGFTMYDLVAYDHKHNEANGWDDQDGADDNRSWNCGWEGDEGAPDDVIALRRRQLRNAMCLLMLSQGTPMFVAGDEFGRTQGGNNNPYNQDNATSWVDWDARDAWLDHEEFVRRLIEFRRDHPILHRREPWARDVTWYGAVGPPDLAEHSRSLAWHLLDGDDELYVLANMWWEQLDFDVQEPGPWRAVVDTSDESGFVDRAECGSVTVDARSIVVLVRTR